MGSPSAKKKIPKGRTALTEGGGGNSGTYSKEQPRGGAYRWNPRQTEEH